MKRIRGLEGDLSVSQVQLESEQSAREAKVVENQRVEQKTNFELKKYEKKIADQVVLSIVSECWHVVIFMFLGLRSQLKEMENLQKHSDHTAMKSKNKIHEQRDEITKLKSKVNELEQV